ncbi:hypothetical protein V2J09_000365 [Rumex salicifolius]
MAGNDLPALGRVKLSDLVASEGLPSDSYKSAVSILCQSLAQYSAAIVKFPHRDAALLRSGLESARLYFNQKPPYSLADMIHANESREWCKTSGYYADSQSWQETYDFRPGITPTQPSNGLEIPPAGLVEIFALLGKASRDMLDAVSFNLNLRSSPFTEILDNVPLRNQEISSSVLSVCCHSRPSFGGAQQHGLGNGEDGHLAMFSEQQHLSDKSLLSIVKSDKAGLHVRHFQGHWVLVDAEISPEEVIVYPGLALYQATAGYISPALHRIETSDSQGIIHGRCSLAFKLMPKSMTILNCSEMRAAGYGVEAQFQLPVSVDDFMQRSHSIDQLFNRQSLSSYDFPTTQEGSVKSMVKRKKTNLKWKPLPPSKRLRLEAQRVLKERVQEIADKKGIKLRFCNLKECENHIHSIESPCANIRLEIGWPPGVPFVHPHDLPNKAKIGFLEAYEPGWSITHDMELTLIDSGHSSQHPPLCKKDLHIPMGVVIILFVVSTKRFLDLKTCKYKDEKIQVEQFRLEFLQCGTVTSVQNVSPKQLPDGFRGCQELSRLFGGFSVIHSASVATFALSFVPNLFQGAPMAKPISIEVWNPNGKYRVISTKSMPGTRWINLLIEQDCRVEICTEKKTILSVDDIIALIGDRCDGVIGQLTEDWGDTLFSALSRAGGKAFSNMAVGYNNVDVNAANKYGVAVGNTPGVLTETTAELAASLSLAAARRVVEADEFMRAGLYDGWLPHLFVGNLLKGQTVGVIGAGRIGSAYARMMVEGFKMNLIYFDLYQATRLEKFCFLFSAYGEFLKANGEQPVTWKRASSMDEVLQQADLISLHPILDKTTYHLVNKERLSKMKKEAILINCSRGPVVDEVALVEHLRENPMFRVGLDVFEDEPYMKPGLADMKNAVVVPHIASASKWTREGMATLAALNVVGKIKGFPIWSNPNQVEPFLDENAKPPAACPSIVNAKELGLPVSKL